jgi:hypothetical protein
MLLHVTEAHHLAVMYAAGVGAATIDLSYRERLFYWIRTVFPNQNHTFHNGALAAAPSSYMSQCIHDFAPPHSDLVFVEVRLKSRPSVGSRGAE